MTEFTSYTAATATGKAKTLLEGIQKAYGFVPNLFAYMAEAPETIEAYLALNDLISKTSLTPAQQQIALLAASTENDCDFCKVAHQALGKAKGACPKTLAAIVAGTPIENASDSALAAFTREMVRERGRASEAAISQFLAAGFTRQQIFEVVLILSIKTLSNYSNHLTHPEANPEFLKML